MKWTQPLILTPLPASPRHLPLNIMAAEAPMAPKNGEYTGLADILAGLRSSSRKNSCGRGGETQLRENGSSIGGYLCHALSLAFTFTVESILPSHWLILTAIRFSPPISGEITKLSTPHMINTEAHRLARPFPFSYFQCPSFHPASRNHVYFFVSIFFIVIILFH